MRDDDVEEVEAQEAGDDEEEAEELAEDEFVYPQQRSPAMTY